MEREARLSVEDRGRLPKKRVTVLVSLIGVACLILPMLAHLLNRHAAGERAEKWREDLSYLAEELLHVHPNLFFRVTRDDFFGAVEDLKGRLISMHDSEIIVGMARIVAMVGDAHTALLLTQPGTGFRRLPVQMYWFSDGIYITKATDEYRGLLGGEVVQIGTSPIGQAIEAMRCVISHDNQAWLRWVTPLYLCVPEVLEALRVVPDAERVTLTLSDAEGKPVKLAVPPIKATDAQWMDATQVLGVAEPLYLQRPEQNYWFCHLPEHRAVYLKYNRCRNIGDFYVLCRELFASVDANGVERLILDLRHNPGGDSRVAEPLLRELSLRPSLTRKGHLFIIVGPGTASAALMLAAELWQRWDAVVVGEPTGGRPNAYGNYKELVLPHSGLIVTCSTQYFQLLHEDLPSLYPDVLVATSSADYLAGRDPVLEAVIGLLDDHDTGGNE